MMKNNLRFFFTGFFLFFSITPLHAKWTQTNGPCYAGILSFAIAQNGTGSAIIYAGGVNAAGVFRSSNNGETWTWMNVGLNSNDGYNVAALTIIDTNLFVGTSGGGLIRCPLNGKRPIAIGNGITNATVNTLAVINTFFFAGTAGGVFRSTDKGASWTAVDSGLTIGFVACLASCSDGAGGTNLFAGTMLDNGYRFSLGGGVFRSTNNGTSWSAVNNGLKASPVFAFAVSPNGTGDKNLFAAGDSGVFLSTDHGTSWTAVNNGLPKYSIHALAAYPNGAGGMNLFAGTNGSGIFRSTDNGTSWTQVNAGLTNGTVYSFSIFSSSDGTGSTNILAGTDGGVFLSADNGLTWSSFNSGFSKNSSLSVPALAFSDSNLIAGTYGGGVSSSTDGGTIWKGESVGLTTSNIPCLFVSHSNYFAGTGNGVFLSINNGASWNQMNNGLIDNGVNSFAASGINLFAGTGNGVFRSSNNGASWSQVNNGLLNISVYSLAVEDTNLFAGTSGGVFLSTDNGSSWSAASTGLNGNGVSVFAVSGKNIFAGTYYGGVFLSTNNGTSWSAVDSGLISSPINAFAVSGTNIFLGDNAGFVFLSTNNGTSWSAINGGLGGLVVGTISSLVVTQTTLFAGTDAGVWSLPLSDIITSVPAKGSASLPTYFKLDQNYPNPFNPSTTISFSIPQHSFVSLKVFDLMGREISTIVSGDLQAGSYSRCWNAKGFSSGVYFYRLQAGTYTQTKRLVLLK
ncbi:MAG: T9SS type A sorting domain-containing protein [Bacteroidota bacterium]